jgi:hypothetical protein
VTIVDTSLGTVITPTGTVAISTDSPGSFTGTCNLSGTGATASCTVTYTPTAPGSHTITAYYPGDTNHVAVSSTFVITVTGKVTPTITSTVTPASIPIGGSASDLASLTGGASPTGTVTYNAYSDSACTTSVFTSASVALGTSSGAFTPATAGTYYWIASYSGDTNNNLVATTCGAAGEILTVTKATPTISSTVTPSTIALGGSAKDLATLTGGFSPTGTVTYTAYSDSACTTLVFTSSGIALGTSSASFTPTATGTYYFVAAYSGDANNAAVSTTCGATGEILTVSAKATPTITSTVTPSSFVIGGSATDLATLTGGSSPTGTITYTAYSDSACTVSVFTDTESIGTASKAFTPAVAGAYYFIASYSGDANNAAVATTCGATNESLTVAKASLSSFTTQIVSEATSSPVTSIIVGDTVYDSATLTGGYPSTGVGGTVTYTFYTATGCTGTGTPEGTFPVGASNSVGSSNPVTPVPAGTYSFQASYSGDANNNPALSACENLTVTKRSTSISTTATGSITVGASASDTANLENGYGPTGSITFNVYFNSPSCTTAPVFTVSVTVSGNALYPSGSFTPASAGTYYWTASYSGDANDLAVSTSCGASGEILTVTPVTPTVTTTVSPASITVGGSATDLATVSGYNPTGTVTYTAYSDSACSTLVFTSSGIALGTPSGAFTPTAAGTYFFKAAYSGDANNVAVTTTCGAAGETLTVASLPIPTLTTVIKDSNGNPVTTIVAGTMIHDTATIVPTPPSTAVTGTVTYSAYLNGQCSGQPVSTPQQVTITSTGTVPDSISGTAGAGTYSLQATYSGDSNNAPATSPCEAVTVTMARPSITSSISPATITLGGSANDLASLSGGFNPTGTVTYTAFSDSVCTTLVFTSSGITLGSPSASFTPSTAGTFYFVAAYSGDANNNAVTTSCGATGETLTVGKATPVVTTTVSPSSIRVGNSATDLATVSGGYSPTGTVTYTAYSDAACTTLVFTSSGIALGSPSAAFSPTVAGTYYFVAAYGGDGNNNAVTTACGALGETLTVSPLPAITITSTVTPSSIQIGGSASDSATLQGGVSPTGTVTYTAYSDSSCTTSVFTDTEPLGTASKSFTPTTAGTYYFVAAYSGDANNNAASSPCGASGETLTVSKATGTLTSQVSPATITIGGSAIDLATRVGYNPTGAVTYTAYSDSACTVQVFTDTEPLGTASKPFTPSVAGTYYFVAAYSGDINNDAISTACGSSGEILTVNKMTPTVTTVVSPASITLGSSATDLATVTGFSPTGAVTYAAYSDSACTALVFTSAGIPLGTPSAAFTPTSTGTYYWIASYSGDANNNAVSTTCGASGETLTVTPTTVQPVLLTFQGYDLDDYCNGVSQLQVFVNGHQVVDIPAGLNHLTGCGDYAPYDDKWISFGPFDISPYVIQGQNNITFADLNTGDHFGRIRDVLITQGSTTLLDVPRSVGIYHTFSKTYTFSNPPLQITSFTVSNSSPTEEQKVTFNATFTGGTAPFFCIFRFGDGGFGFALASHGSCSVRHDFEYSGTFNVTVTVIGASTSDRATAQTTVGVSEEPGGESATVLLCNSSTVLQIFDPSTFPDD